MFSQNAKGWYSNKNTNSKGLVSYANHTLEFLGFFETHKNLCDKLSGIKEVELLNSNNKILISRQNFLLSLNHVNAFIIKYRYGVIENAKKKDIMDRFYKLESDFLNDTLYHSLVKKADSITLSQSIILNKLYLQYLKRCYDLVFLMGKYLQGHLNITNLSFLKTLDYLDYEGFYRNLDSYRDEVSHNLAMLKYDNITDGYKKVMGFVYTYKYLLSDKTIKKIDILFNQIFNFVIDKDYLKNVIKYKDGILSDKARKENLYDFKIIRDWLNLVIDYCHEEFSGKRILPRVDNKQKIDLTLI